MKNRARFAAAIAIVLLATACRPSLGLGTIDDPVPPGLAVPSDWLGNPVEPIVTDNVTGPVPTNDWWTSLVFPRFGNRYSENLYPQPMTARATATGLELGHPTSPTITPTGTEYSYGHQRDLTLGVVGLDAPETAVDGWGDWTVRSQWDDGTRSMTATLGHGLPYAQADITGGDAVVDFVVTPTVYADLGSVRGVTVNGNNWGLFAPTGTAWQTSGTTMTAATGAAGYVAVAALPDDDPATLDLFAAHAYAFVTDTTVSWSVDRASSTVTTTFDFATQPREGTETRPLTALYRHQWMYSTTPTTGLSYASPRGEMKLAATQSFTTTTPYNGIVPALPDVNLANQEQLWNLVDQVYREIDLIPATDTYGSGKYLGRLAELVPIADQVGHDAARDRFLTVIRTELEDWFTRTPGETDRFLAYEPTWGTLLGYDPAYGSATEINDHQFHWGYFVKAAATVAWYDPAWAADDQWGAMVNQLIDDVANTDRGDDHYPFLRTFDPYAGHSWASGHSAFAAGANQESSSEALNFASSVALWGAATADTELEDLGLYLYATEVQAVEQYWFDVDNAVFPPGWDKTTAGMVWSQGAAHATWFTDDVEKIHGINVLPVTGGSLYLGRRTDQILARHQAMIAENGGPATAWQDILWEQLALADAPSALAQLEADPGYVPEEGESRAHTYQWVATLDRLGTLDTQVTANSPFAAAFTKGGVRTYVGWNPTAVQATIQFSDGASLTIGARTLSSSAGPDTGPLDDPPPTTTTTTTTVPTGSGNAYDWSEAESADQITGTQLLNDPSAGGGAGIGTIGDGDSLRFDSVDFGTTSPSQVVTVAAGGSESSGLVRYRLDSPTGPVIGDFAIADTGGWGTWTDIPANTPGPATGIRDLYITFESGSGVDFVNLDRFQFVE